MKAYRTRPWRCDNVTGDEEHLYLCLCLEETEAAISLPFLDLLFVSFS